MGKKGKTAVEAAVRTANFLVISYALDAMALVFRSHPVFILFFASNIWLLTWHYQQLTQLFHRRVPALLLEGDSLVLLALTVWRTGYLDASLVPWT